MYTDEPLGPAKVLSFLAEWLTVRLQRRILCCGWQDPHHLNKQTDHRVLFTVSSLVYKYKSSINLLCLHISSVFRECLYTVPILASQT